MAKLSQDARLQAAYLISIMTKYSGILLDQLEIDADTSDTLLSIEGDLKQLKETLRG